MEVHEQAQKSKVNESQLARSTAMNRRPFSIAVQLLIFSVFGCMSAIVAAEKPKKPKKSAKPETPRIDCVIPLPEQPHAKDPATIWYDDFDGKPKPYAEGKSPLDDKVALGARGKSMLCLYGKGKRGSAGRKVFFGDSPAYVRKTVRRGEKFDEVYWRIYVKHQYGWKGSPDKMSRATSIVSGNWAQAMIAHVWSSRASSLTLDPVRCVKGAKVLTRKYNDWQGMKWLGNKPVSEFPIHATAESGCWVLVESRAKLNTPGKKDGINQLWIDGRLECERRNLNFRGSYTKHGINAVFLEAYWNKGSPVTQRRWYDNFVISTKPIGPVVCPANPTVIKTPYRGPGKAGGWELELAADYGGKDVVYRSKRLPPGNRAVVSVKHGEFRGSLAGKKALTSGKIFFLRVRQNSSEGMLSEWSRWHQGFRVK
jgi:hypothetical protein